MYFKATSTPSPPGPAPLCASVSPGLPHQPGSWGAQTPYCWGEDRAIQLQTRTPSLALHWPVLLFPDGHQLQRAPVVPRALVAISVPSHPRWVSGAALGSYRCQISG